MSNLLPDLPKEIRAARIGTCYNPISRKLLDKNIIDTKRLDPSAIDMVHGKGELQLRADASTAQNAQKTFFGLDSQVKVGSWVSLGYHMETSQSEVTTSNTLNCYFSYVHKGQSLVLQNKGPEDLLNYLTSEFQTDLLALLNEKNTTIFLKLYLDFTRKYGYGCITELYLTSGSAFVMNVKYSSTATATSANYRGNVGIGTPWGGGSVAVDFAKEVLATDSQAGLSCVAEQLPEDTPTKEWSNTLMSTLIGMGLSELSKKPEVITPYKGGEPKAPDIPQGKPTEKKLPKGDTPDISDAMKKELMKTDNFSGTWEEYIKAQQNAYEKLKPQNIVGEACANRERLLSLKLEESSSDVVAPEDTFSDVAWDLGGYMPYSYTITPWSKLFPQLKGIGLPTTFTSIYIAKAYVYYLTRLEFGSYLYFLTDIGGEICENDSIAIDAKSYADVCDRLAKKINELISLGGGVFTANDYEKVVASFEQDIAHLPNFYSRDTYWYFFMNYKFFIDNACGFIGVIFSGGTYYTPGKPVSTKPLPRPFSVVQMLTDGLRFYPVMTPKAKLKIYARFPTYWTLCVDIVDSFHAERKIDNNGYAYYSGKEYTLVEKALEPISVAMDFRYYSAGFSELKTLSGIGICGRPVITPFDYDSILQFANPNKPVGRS